MIDYNVTGETGPQGTAGPTGPTATNPPGFLEYIGQTGTRTSIVITNTGPTTTTFLTALPHTGPTGATSSLLLQGILLALNCPTSLHGLTAYTNLSGEWEIQASYTVLGGSIPSIGDGIVYYGNYDFTV